MCNDNKVTGLARGLPHRLGALWDIPPVETRIHWLQEGADEEEVKLACYDRYDAYAATKMGQGVKSIRRGFGIIRYEDGCIENVLVTDGSLWKCPLFFATPSLQTPCNLNEFRAIGAEKGAIVTDLWQIFRTIAMSKREWFELQCDTRAGSNNNTIFLSNDTRFETVKGILRLKDTLCETVQGILRSKDTLCETIQGILRSKDTRCKTVQGILRSKDTRCKTVQGIPRSKDTRYDTAEGMLSVDSCFCMNNLYLSYRFSLNM